MSLRDSLNKVADRIRAIPSLSAIDERPTSLTIRTTTWSGGQTKVGTATDVDLVITPVPRIREVNVRDIAGSGGRYEDGDVLVGPITPSYTGGGGYTEAQLAPTFTVGGKVVTYILAGNLNGEYSRSSIQTDRSHQITLVLSKTRKTQAT